MIGIYKILNTKNNKVYIGQTKDYDKRIREHIRYLKNNTHQNKYLQRTYNKYGVDIFEFSLIEECSEKELTIREQYWIDFYGGVSDPKNYNLREAGSEGTFSEEVLHKIRTARLGKPHSEESKKKMSKAHMGKILSEKTKRLISKNNTRPHLGKSLSSETKKKIGDANRGKKRTEAQREAIRLSKLGKPRKPHSEESKKKISDTLKKNTYDRPQAKKVDKYTLDGKYISTYNSIGEAQRITNIYNISAACRGQYKSAGGFIWKFTDG
jgi:group I intron endonuclease